MGTRASAVEADALREVIALLNLPLERARLLREVAALCGRAAGCEHALIYLWDEDEQALVARAATEGFQHLEGELALGLGEGVAGWCALHREPVLIADRAPRDPRFRFVPAIDEDRFQSMLTCPLLGRAGALVGVVIMRTQAPHEFSRADLEVVQGICALVGGSVQNWAEHARTAQRLQLLEAAQRIGAAAAGAATSRQGATAIARIAAEALGADLVVLLEAPPGTHRRGLAVRAFAQAGGAGAAVTAARARDVLSLDDVAPGSAVRAGGGQHEDVLALARAAGGAPFAAAVAAPLDVCGRRAGHVVAYARDGDAMGGAAAEHVALLAPAAAAALVALDATEEAGAGGDAAAHVLEAVLAGGREPRGTRRAAAALGLDLDAPLRVLVAQPLLDGAGDDALAALAGALPAAAGGIAAVAGGRLRALLPVAPGLEEAVARLFATVDEGGALAAALSDPCHGRAALPAGAAEGEDALGAALALGLPTRLVRRDDLGIARFLGRAVREAPPDALERRIAALRDEDEDGAELVRTLEVYLECLCRPAAAAERLFLHRNSLRHRLGRLRARLAVDPDDPAQAHALLVAIKLARLRAARA